MIYYLAIYIDKSPLPVKGCVLTYARHSWPLSSEFLSVPQLHCTVTRGTNKSLVHVHLTDTLLNLVDKLTGLHLHHNSRDPLHFHLKCKLKSHFQF